MDDLTPECELGSGTSGHVIKMRHNQSGELLAVKVTKKNKQLKQQQYIKLI